MAKYMLLIYGDEQSMPEPGSKAMEEEGTKYEVFTKSIVAEQPVAAGQSRNQNQRRAGGEDRAPAARVLQGSGEG